MAEAARIAQAAQTALDDGGSTAQANLQDARAEVRTAIDQAAAEMDRVRTQADLVLKQYRGVLVRAAAEVEAQAAANTKSAAVIGRLKQQRLSAELHRLQEKHKPENRHAKWTRDAETYRRQILDAVRKLQRQERLEKIQFALGIASTVLMFFGPTGLIISAGLDLINGSISLVRGNYLDAGLCFLGALGRGAKAVSAYRRGVRLLASGARATGRAVVRARLLGRRGLCKVIARIGCFVPGTLVIVPPGFSVYRDALPQGALDDSAQVLPAGWNRTWLTLAGASLILAGAGWRVLRRRRPAARQPGLTRPVTKGA